MHIHTSIQGLTKRWRRQSLALGLLVGLGISTGPLLAEVGQSPRATQQQNETSALLMRRIAAIGSPVERYQSLAALRSVQTWPPSLVAGLKTIRTTDDDDHCRALAHQLLVERLGPQQFESDNALPDNSYTKVLLSLAASSNGTSSSPSPSTQVPVSSKKPDVQVRPVAAQVDTSPARIAGSLTVAVAKPTPASLPTPAGLKTVDTDVVSADHLAGFSPPSLVATSSQESPADTLPTPAAMVTTPPPATTTNRPSLAPPAIKQAMPVVSSPTPAPSPTVHTSAKPEQPEAPKPLAGIWPEKLPEEYDDQKNLARKSLKMCRTLIGQGEVQKAQLLLYRVQELAVDYSFYELQPTKMQREIDRACYKKYGRALPGACLPQRKLR